MLGKDFMMRNPCCGVVYVATAGITSRIASAPDFSGIVFSITGEAFETTLAFENP
jgi:hypothetical protein